MLSGGVPDSTLNAGASSSMNNLVGGPLVMAVTEFEALPIAGGVFELDGTIVTVN